MSIPYDIEIGDRLRKKLKKLENKDKSVYNSIIKKMLQIAEKPYVGKHLHGRMKSKRRVHIGHFVLIYAVNEKEHRVIFLEFEHHDEAYR